MSKRIGHSAKRIADESFFALGFALLRHAPCAMRHALCALLFLPPASCYAAGAQQGLKAANKLYHKGKLDEALQKYKESSVSLPDSDIINFNLGVAFYKKEDYQKAIDAFTKVLTSDDKKIEADALYNLGNCKYKLGKLKEDTDLSSAVALLRESLDYYKRAVEIDQKNNDARFNHEFVERELKVLLDKLKQQQSSSDKQTKQKQQDGQTSPTGKEEAEGKQGKKESAQAQKQQQEEKKEEGQGASPQEEKRQEQAQAAKEASGQEESFGSAEDRQGKELSEEGARALLERYGRDEATPDHSDRRPSGESEVAKDW